MDKRLYNIGMIVSGALLVVMCFGVGMVARSPWMMLWPILATIFAWLSNAAGTEDQEAAARGFGYIAVMFTLFAVVSVLFGLGASVSL